jgi:hypothetical protein
MEKSKSDVRERALSTLYGSPEPERDTLAAMTVAGQVHRDEDDEYQDSEPVLCQSFPPEEAPFRMCGIGCSPRLAKTQRKQHEQLRQQHCRPYLIRAPRLILDHKSAWAPLRQY